MGNGLRNTNGFTMLEIIAVLLILGLVLALVLPRIGQSEGLANTSRKLIGTIRSLHTAATTSKRLHRLYVDLDRHAYWWTRVDSNRETSSSDPLLHNYVSLPSHIRFQDVSTFHQGKTDSGRGFIQFFPQGGAEKAVIHLTDENKNVLTLALNALTARVRVIDGYWEPPVSQPIRARLWPFLHPVPASPHAPFPGQED